MAVVSKVRITDGSVSVIVNISYRWYVPGDDPWTRVSGVSTAFPASGMWENRAINGSTGQIRMYTLSEGSIAQLDNFTRVTVGSTGTGNFMTSGYTIREYADITWKVLSVKS
jgi:hypothetical protein